MTVGNRIKTLRKNANLTQERLAEILSISPQAVSRWETDVAMPDISLLPPIANLFEVTTDYILGMDNYQKNARKAMYEAAYKDYWKSYDKEENYKIATEAVKEYPNSMAYLEWLASSEYYVGLTKDGKESTDYIESSVKHYKSVIDKCDDKDTYDSALNGIVLALKMLGESEKAKEYAMLHKNEEKRDELLLYCSEGEEREALVQKICERYLNGLLCYFAFSNNIIEKSDAIERILQILLPDGNYQYYHNIVQFSLLEKAKLLCDMERYSDAIDALEKARFHSDEMEKYDRNTWFAFTSPLFNKVSGVKEHHNLTSDSVDTFITYINNNSSFDLVRDTPSVSKLLIK